MDMSASVTDQPGRDLSLQARRNGVRVRFLRLTASDTVLVNELDHAKIAVADTSSLSLVRERIARPEHNRNVAGHPEGQWPQRFGGPAHRNENLTG